MDRASIIIRCKNEEKYIGQVLDMVFAQHTAAAYDVIVVDSGSSDRTLEVAGTYDVRIFQIPPESFTFGYALNYGIEQAEGRIIVNLSAHCIPTGEDWLDELIKPIVDSRAHGTFGRQVAIKGLNAFEEVSLSKHFPDHAVIPGRQPFSNANCAFLRALWSERKFDEELTSWEDFLWYYLMKDSYTFQYCPKAAVFHTHPFSLKAIAKRAYGDGRAFKVIKRKYDIDFLDGVCPTLRTKVKIFKDDMENHVKLFLREGYARYIFLIPVVRFFAYKAYWDGYNSVD